jgi:hypothetical protein
MTTPAQDRMELLQPLREEALERREQAVLEGRGPIRPGTPGTLTELGLRRDPFGGLGSAAGDGHRDARR